MSQEEQLINEERLWAKIFLPVDRICSNFNCGKHFSCTGHCPPNRWARSIGDMKNRYACFCRECLMRSTFSISYIEGRLKCYYEGEE